MAIDKTINLDVNTGDSKKDIDGVNSALGKTGGSAGGAKKGLKGLAGGFKGLGLAWKAMGIGALITAFKTLKSLFTGNIETARKLERMGAFLAASFDVVRDAVEPLFTRLLEGFSNPKKAIEDLWTALKQNIVNRIQGLIDGFGALGKVIKGVFKRDLDLIKEGASEAGTAFIQLGTGLDETQQKDSWNKLGKQIKQITKDIEAEGNAAMRLTQIMQDVRDEERDMLLIRAKANQQIAESRLLAEDDTKSKQERLTALKAAVAEEQRVAKIELDIQEKKVNAMQAMIDLGKSSEADIQKLAEERARFIDLQTGSTLRQKRVAAEVGVFTAQVEKEKADAENAALKRSELLVKAKELELEVNEEFSNKQIELLIKTADKEKEIAEKKAKDLKKIQDAEISSRKAANISAAKSLLGSLGSIAGEGTKAAKAAALAGMLIDTATGISSSIANATKSAALAGPGAAVFTPILIAQLIGQVLGGIGSARAILKKVPGGGGGGGDESVSTPSPSSVSLPEQLGGIGGTIPNMESIIPGGANGIQPVQAYVVETDISDSQALQEELEIQATL